MKLPPSRPGERADIKGSAGTLRSSRKMGSLGKEVFEHGPSMWAFIWSANALLVAYSHFISKTSFASPFLAETLPVSISASFISLPFLLPAHDYQFRGVVLFAACFYAIKVREAICEKRYHSEPLWIRIASVNATFFDAQERKPAAPWRTPRLKQLRGFAIEFALHLLCLIATIETFRNRFEFAKWILWSFGLIGYAHAIRVAVGCISGCLFVFFSLHIYVDSLNLIWCLIGFVWPSGMDSPEQALSVRDFWIRWDTVIQKLLRKYVFIPAKEAGVSSQVAAFLTFMASGLVHILPIIVTRPNDWLATVSMVSYFLVQFALILVERRLGIYTWNDKYRWTARIFTILCLFGPSYLLVMPMLRIAQIDI